MSEREGCVAMQWKWKRVEPKYSGGQKTGIAGRRWQTECNQLTLLHHPHPASAWHLQLLVNRWLHTCARVALAARLSSCIEGLLQEEDEAFFVKFDLH
jgi:hypothetical protein